LKETKGKTTSLNDEPTKEPEVGVEEALATLQLEDKDEEKVEEKDDDHDNAPPHLVIEPNPLFGSFSENEDEDILASFAEDQDLVAALLSIGDDDDDKDDNDEHHLPDIEFDFGDDGFLDPDQLGTVFDDFSPAPVEEEPEEEVLDRLAGDITDVDHDTEELYQELANLSLDVPSSSDGLPSYLFCQPCSPEGEFFEPLHQTLPSITEDEALAEGLTNVERQSEGDFPQLDDLEDLLKLSLLQLDEEDTLIKEMDAQHHSEQGEVRPEAQRAAQPLLEAFAKERSCLGHRETIFGVTFSECGKFCATASQDSMIHIWNVEKNALLTSLKEHSKKFECLRVAWASSTWASDVLDRKHGDFVHLLASSGADGVVKLWGCHDPMQKNGWICHLTLDHSTLLGRSDKKEEKIKIEEIKEGDEEDKNEENKEDDEESNAEENKDADKPQTYALAFIDHWKIFATEQDDMAKNCFLMTSSDDYIHFWEIEAKKSEQIVEIVGDKIRMVPDEIQLKEVMSVHFGPLELHGYGVTACNITGSGLQLPSAPSYSSDGTAFGGYRNPNNRIFVFDAAYCSANGLLGVALSDGSLRLVNGRGVCISIVSLPGCQSHLTSFCWDSTGTRLATSVATGHLITWKLNMSDVEGQGHIVATCSGIMEGGTLRGESVVCTLFIEARKLILLFWNRSSSRAPLVWFALLWSKRGSNHFLECRRKPVLMGCVFARQH
jgi:WD40 repeat protein